MNAKGLAAPGGKYEKLWLFLSEAAGIKKCTVETFVDITERQAVEEQGKFIMRINQICL